MASERIWVEIPTQTFTSDGTTEGLIQIADTSNIKVKHKIRIQSNTQPSLNLEVKKVVNSTTIQVGPPGSKMRGPGATSDISQYTVGDTSILVISEQDRPAIYLNDINRAVYEEEPTVAIRTVLVDTYGDRVADDNPLPVKFSEGINVQLTDQESEPGAKDYDIVRIGDGTNQLTINPDGSINFKKQGRKVLSTFNQVSAVAPNSETLINSYVVPPSKSAILDKITASGENIAKYNIYVNLQLVDVKRTYYTGGFNVEFQYTSSDNEFQLDAGDIIEVKVIHNTSDPGEFDARLQIIEID